jgi:two-component sensor histidine kinase
MDDQARAFNVLFTDLLEKILSMSDSPGKCADYLSENLRSLIGAKTVLVLECTQRSGDVIHDIISVFPERRRKTGYHEAVQDIAVRSHDFRNAGVFHRSGEGPIPDALGRLEIDSAIVAPIQHAETRMGVIILLDLMDATGCATIIETLDRLTPAFALVLRNAFLYNNLEEEVSRRTVELEDRSARLAKALEEKEVMIKEVHHRVKNNLQIVTSLLFLQADASESPELRDALKKSQGRIHSMALVHEELYRSADLASVDMRDYVRKLCDNLASMIGSATPIVFDGCAELWLPITHSIPCGLILNELVTNALKYAYPDGQGGEVRVSMAEHDGTVRLAVEDDGIGLRTAQGGPVASSLGLSLVRGLAEQLHGRLGVIDRSTTGAGVRGARFEVEFRRSDA